MKEHVGNLKIVLEVLQMKLYAKASKCVFGCKEVEYLRHIISKTSVKVDPMKISTMLEWPTMRTLGASKGFLGLTDYYRRFFKGNTLLQHL